VESNVLRSCLKNCKGSGEERRTSNGKKQIPCGNDRKKGKSKGNGKGNNKCNGNGKKQIPGGSDRKKGKSKGKG
jgi:hypothetical protein